MSIRHYTAYYGIAGRIAIDNEVYTNDDIETIANLKKKEGKMVVNAVPREENGVKLLTVETIYQTKDGESVVLSRRIEKLISCEI